MITLDQAKVGDALPALAYDVTSTTVVLGALAARDWRPMHHDYHFAVDRQGVKDVFLNSPNQGSWLERFVTDWTGPKGRLGRFASRCASRSSPATRWCSRAPSAT